MIAAFAFTAQSANAGERHHHHHFGKLTAVSIGVGAASTAGYFAINDWKWNGRAMTAFRSVGAVAVTTIGCTAVTPMVANACAEPPADGARRARLWPACVIPIIGGWLVNAAYDAHPEWEPAQPD